MYCRHKDFLVNSSLKATKKIGWGNLKNSGERSRAILALLFSILFGRLKKHCGKGKNACYQHFYPFSTMFLKRYKYKTRPNFHLG